VKRTSSSLLRSVKRAGAPRLVTARKAAAAPRLVSAVKRAGGLLGSVLILSGDACSAFTDFGNWEESQASGCASGPNAACVNANCCAQYDICVSGEADGGVAGACSAAINGTCTTGDPVIQALETCLINYCGAPPCGG
jgi:hypothetical protein